MSASIGSAFKGSLKFIIFSFGFKLLVFQRFYLCAEGGGGIFAGSGDHVSLPELLFQIIFTAGSDEKEQEVKRMMVRKSWMQADLCMTRPPCFHVWSCAEDAGRGEQSNTDKKSLSCCGNKSVQEKAKVFQLPPSLK